jgi:hypothetical protein
VSVSAVSYPSDNALDVRTREAISDRFGSVERSLGPSGQSVVDGTRVGLSRHVAETAATSDTRASEATSTVADGPTG